MIQGTARYFVAVYLAAAVALLWLFLPGDWRGLAVLPVLAGWVLLASKPHPRGSHELGDEDQADELGELDPLPAFRPSPELARWAGFPDPDADPIGYYQAVAHDRTGEPWHQQEPDQGPHLVLNPHLQTAPGPVGVLQPKPGPVPNHAGGPATAERKGTAGPSAATPPGDKDAMELALEANDRAELGIAPLPELGDTWPDPGELAASTALERTRAEFDLLRRMWL